MIISGVVPCADRIREDIPFRHPQDWACSGHVHPRSCFRLRPQTSAESSWFVMLAFSSMPSFLSCQSADGL
eukprot:15076310-Alexandrium_andersonii.AAC.1